LKKKKFLFSKKPRKMSVESSTRETIWGKTGTRTQGKEIVASGQTGLTKEAKDQLQGKKCDESGGAVGGAVVKEVKRGV